MLALAPWNHLKLLWCLEGCYAIILIAANIHFKVIHQCYQQCCNSVTVSCLSYDSTQISLYYPLMFVLSNMKYLLAESAQKLVFSFILNPSVRCFTFDLFHHQPNFSVNWRRKKSWKMIHLSCQISQEHTFCCFSRNNALTC